MTHAFEEKSLLRSSDIAKATIKQPFMLLEVCSASDFSYRNSLGSAYLFGQNSDVLVISGLTTKGSMYVSNPSIHSTGEAFGNNFLNHIQDHDIVKKASHRTLEPIAAFRYLLYMLYHGPIQQSPEKIIAEVIWYQGMFALVNFMVNYYGPLDFAQVGHTLLGDPTLKPYIDMDWCPEYGETK